MTAAASDELPPVCILAGGMGTRLGRIAQATPKIMVPVAGRPFMFHLLEHLAANGASRVVLCVGHLGDQIEDAVGDGSPFGLDVSYSRDPASGPAGTAGAIRGALGQLGPRFLVTYGDTYLRLDYGDFTRSFLRSELPAQMTVLENDGRWGESNADVLGGLVRRHSKRLHHASFTWIDYGLGAFKSSVFAGGPAAEPSDLSDVYSRLAGRGELGAFPVSERFYEIGSPAALAETDAFLSARSRGPKSAG